MLSGVPLLTVFVTLSVSPILLVKVVFRYFISTQVFLSKRTDFHVSRYVQNTLSVIFQVVEFLLPCNKICVLSYSVFVAYIGSQFIASLCNLYIYIYIYTRYPSSASPLIVSFSVSCSAEKSLSWICCIFHLIKTTCYLETLITFPTSTLVLNFSYHWYFVRVLCWKPYKDSYWSYKIAKGYWSSVWDSTVFSIILISNIGS